MAFQSLGDQSLDAIVNVRVTAVEKAQLQEDAEMAGVSLSALVRANHFGRRLTVSADRLMLSELRKLGGLLKQVGKESNGLYGPLTSDALIQMQGCIKTLSSKVVSEGNPK